MSEWILETGGSLVSTDVRRHNLGLIASSLARRGPLSRSQLATTTGLTRGAVTALVGILIDARIVSEAGLERGEDERGVDPDHKGRPRVMLELTASHIALVALQLDADKATALVTALDGAVLSRVVARHDRPVGNPETILDVLASVFQQALVFCGDHERQVADVTVVVFASAGGDPPVVIADTDLGWGPVDVIGGLRSRVPDMPDARLVGDNGVAALAELSRFDGLEDLLYLRSNSGVGGAIIIGGRLVVGARNLAGALGHIAVDYDGLLCDCGQRGCLVTVAGPDVMLDNAGLGDTRENGGLAVALDEFVMRVKAGEKQAVEAWSGGLLWIGRALHILTATIDPQVIVVGGYWAAMADSIQAEYNRGDSTVPCPTIRILPGRLGDDAALFGAIWTARDRLLQDPISAVGNFGTGALYADPPAY